MDDEALVVCIMRRQADGILCLRSSLHRFRYGFVWHLDRRPQLVVPHIYTVDTASCVLILGLLGLPPHYIDMGHAVFGLLGGRIHLGVCLCRWCEAVSQ